MLLASNSFGIFSTTNLAELILALIAIGLVGMRIYKRFVDRKTFLSKHRVDMDKKRSDAEIREEEEYREKLIFKFLDAYIKLNSDVFELLESDTKANRGDIRNLTSIAGMTHSQVDVILRYLKQYHTESCGEVKSLNARFDELSRWCHLMHGNNCNVVKSGSEGKKKEEE